MVTVPESIVCVECGGTAHLLTGFPPDEPPLPGEIAAYACIECNHRMDVVLEEDA